MAEQLNLNAPVTHCFVIELRMVWAGARSQFHILVEGRTGASPQGKVGAAYTHDYLGAEAEAFLDTLNTADCSVKSMHRRVLERLDADGIIKGNVSGSPDPPGGGPPASE